MSFSFVVRSIGGSMRPHASIEEAKADCLPEEEIAIYQNNGDGTITYFCKFNKKQVM